MEEIFKIIAYVGLALVFLSLAMILSFVCSDVASDRRKRHTDKHGEG